MRGRHRRANHSINLPPPQLVGPWNGDIDDEELLESLEAGAHDTTTDNPVNTRTLNLFYDLFDAYLED